MAGAHVRTRAVRATAVAAGFGLGVASGASRVVLNVHYVTDVLAGWCVGTAWATGTYIMTFVVQRLTSKRKTESKTEEPLDEEPAA